MELLTVPEIGEKIADSILAYFQEEKHIKSIQLFKVIGIRTEISESLDTTISDIFEGKTFVVSGVFESFSRDELKKDIVSRGGKVVSSISAKLSYLVAGDKMGPSKLEKATNLGVNIISETEYLELTKA